jgi:phage terminase large subunit-like protein
MNKKEPPTTPSSSPQNSSDASQNVSFVSQRARENLIDFSIATNSRYEPNWHHEVIAQELERIEQFGDRDYKVLLVFVPPRHGKSELCSIGFPAWYLGRNPQKEIITVSYSAELAQDFGSKTRSIVSGEAYPHIFSGITLKEDEQAKAKWRTSRGGSYTSVGVGGAITGRGANVLLFDDPIKNREEAESEVYREKVWQFFTSTAFTRLEPGGVVVVILTRWHLDDLAGRILANAELSKRCKIVHFPAVATKKEKYREEGEALWPERFNLEALEEIKNTIGPYDWQSLYQGSPVLTERQEFKPEWYKKVSETYVETMSCQRHLTIDTAISKSSSADYTGFCDNRVNSENFWFLKAWRMRLGAEELVDAIFALHTKYHYDSIGIEKTVYLDGLKPYLDEKQRQRNMFLPIVELKHNQTQKEVRIRGLIPRYATGSIFHIEGETHDLEEEMMQFPRGMHDDVLDATAYQLQITAEENSGQVSVHIPDYFVQ